jgi:hypothetical protein
MGNMTAKNEEFIISYMNEVKTQFESGHAKEHAYRPATSVGGVCEKLLPLSYLDR